MLTIPVIAASVRRNRTSIHVARFLQSKLREKDDLDSELLDLLEYDFPIMEERLRFRDDPPAGLKGFARKLAGSDGILIVTPEYNSGYPGVLKNALDFLLPEFRHKPVGIATVSAGTGGGLICLSQLRQVLLAMGAIPIPGLFAVREVQKAFAENGEPLDTTYDGRAEKFLAELIWLSKSLSEAGRP